MKIKRQRLIASATAVTAAIAMAAPAAAGAGSPLSDPTDAEYDPSIRQVIALSGGGEAADPADPSEAVGGLPFTGLDAGLMAAAALGLLGGGVAVRRLATRTQEQR